MIAVATRWRYTVNTYGLMPCLKATFVVVVWIEYKIWATTTTRTGTIFFKEGFILAIASKGFMLAAIVSKGFMLAIEGLNREGRSRGAFVGVLRPHKILIFPSIRKIWNSWVCVNKYLLAFLRWRHARIFFCGRCQHWWLSISGEVTTWARPLAA